MKDNKYVPNVVDTSDIVLSKDLEDLIEAMAKNVHDTWAKNRIEQGWTLGPKRDDDKKQTPCLVEYEDLPDIEKDYDRNTAIETLKFIIKMGFQISKSK